MRLFVCKSAAIVLKREGKTCACRERERERERGSTAPKGHTRINRNDALIYVNGRQSCTVLSRDFIFLPTSVPPSLHWQSIVVENRGLMATQPFLLLLLPQSMSVSIVSDCALFYSCLCALAAYLKAYYILGIGSIGFLLSPFLCARHTPTPGRLHIYFESIGANYSRVYTLLSKI